MHFTHWAFVVSSIAAVVATPVPGNGRSTMRKGSQVAQDPEVNIDPSILQTPKPVKPIVIPAAAFQEHDVEPIRHREADEVQSIARVNGPDILSSPVSPSLRTYRLSAAHRKSPSVELDLSKLDDPRAIVADRKHKPTVSSVGGMSMDELFALRQSDDGDLESITGKSMLGFMGDDKPSSFTQGRTMSDAGSKQFSVGKGIFGDRYSPTSGINRQD